MYKFDYYQHGYSDALYGFSYIPDFNSKDDKKEYIKGYSDGLKARIDSRNNNPKRKQQ